MMMLIFAFQCADAQSIVQIQTTQKNVKLHLIPSTSLTVQESITCLQMKDQTAIFEVFIGRNSFRSIFITYDPSITYDIILTPFGNSSTESAVTFFIATYEITFLETDLIQQGSIAELNEIYFDYRECFIQQALQYETNVSFQVILQTNPLCEILTDGPVKYDLKAKESMQSGEISNKDFNFSKIEIPAVLCESGTPEEVLNCKLNTLMLSGDNFIFVDIFIDIPQVIKANDTYYDDENNLISVENESTFMLQFKLNVNERTSSEDCVQSSHVAFAGEYIFISQIPTGSCVFDYHRAVFWVEASENSNNLGRRFQLQISDFTPFNARIWVGCQFWRESNFSSVDACREAVFEVQTYPENFSTNIIYKIYDEEDVFQGSFIFPSISLDGGGAVIIVSTDNLCATFDFQAETTNLFVEIEIRFSTTLEDLRNQKYQVNLQDNFLYPSSDNAYCYQINAQDQDLLEKLVFRGYFSEIVIRDHIGYVKELITIIPYEFFWVGPLISVLAVIVAVIYIVVIQKLKKKKRLAAK